MEESIYSLVQEEPEKVQKPPLYRSRHPGKTAPTASTFNNAQTSRPGVSNLAGSGMDIDTGNHRFKKDKGNFGSVPGSAMPDPKTFLHSRKQTVATLAEMTKKNPGAIAPQKLKTSIKEPLPKDKPIMNLVTSKNFIVSNAVDNILMAPKKVHNNDPDYMNKEDYGKAPEYLNRIKNDINAEYDYIRELKEEQRQAEITDRALPEDERLDLLEALKAKWEHVNREYQGKTHITLLDTVGQVRRKEHCEKQLSQIEKDIEKLRRPGVSVML